MSMCQQDTRTKEEFWGYLELLVKEHPIVIDRHQNSSHPLYPRMIYPLDYGYLDGTAAIDGGGIDLWLGSRPDRSLDGVILTIDLEKSDSEIKLLLGCTDLEKQIVLQFLNGGAMRALLVNR